MGFHMAPGVTASCGCSSSNEETNPHSAMKPAAMSLSQSFSVVKVKHKEGGTMYSTTP